MAIFILVGDTPRRRSVSSGEGETKTTGGCHGYRFRDNDIFGPLVAWLRPVAETGGAAMPAMIHDRGRREGSACYRFHTTP
jgi:hypothetical protein